MQRLESRQPKMDTLPARNATPDTTAVTVCVRGNGIVGCSAALALARLGYPVVLEGSAAGLAPGAAEGAADIRTYALNAASVALLQRLKVWEALPAQAACPVLDMRIHGDEAERPGQLEFSAWRQGLEALAWIVDAGALEAVLRQAVRFAPHITLREAELTAAPALQEQTLLVLCEGRDSTGRQALGVGFERLPYGHHALATRITASQPHAGAATQWFGHPDVLALLPFDRPNAGASYGVVWSLPQERAAALREASPAEFEAELQAATGGACGELRLAGERHTWPLMLGRAQRVHGPGFVLLGDCAHAVHPLAGQGLNLGLGDVASLEAVMAAREPWRSPGDERLLARHARARAEATAAMAGVTDGLWHLFSHPNPLVRTLRNRGMNLLNHLPALKRQLTRRALGAFTSGGLGLGLALAMAAAVPEPAQAQAPGQGGSAPSPAAGATAAAAAAPAAVDAAIRKALLDRMPTMPKPDEITRTPVTGLWELRFGNEILYTDDKGEFLISGPIIETRTRRDLTAERIDKLTAIQFANLPMKDAIVIKQGNGTRKVVVFSDPNCGFCKRFERDLAGLKDVTLYTFLYPILGKDSQEKSRNIWCAADPAKAWREWMVEGRTPPVAMGRCDATALERNKDLGQRHRIESTPTSVFEDGSRRSGALPANEFERLLSQAKPPKS